MNNCLTQVDIENLLAGSLSPESEALYAAHLESCEKCQVEVASHREDNRLFTKIRRAYDGEVALAERPSRPVAGETAQAAFPTIRGYEIIDEIHRGGQGTVYKAVQTATKRVVALKVLLSGTQASERQRRRFEREVDLAAGLKHPNVVTIYDSGVAQGHYYFAMEYIHGRPLDRYVAEQGLGLTGILQLMRKVCAAVSYAHQQGVIHRDLKPDNIRVDAQGEPHILDLGLAKAAGAHTAAGAPMTVTSEFMGTLAYASPEQVSGDPATVDVRTDVYSLGVILHLLITGRHPYRLAGSLVEIVKEITETPPARPSSLRRGLHDDLEVILLTALAKDKERRYQSAGELAQDIRHFLDGRAIVAKKDKPAYVLGVVTRTLVRRHVAASLAIGGVIAVLAAQLVGDPLVNQWTTLNATFERKVATMIAPAVGATLADVAVIRINNGTPMEQLAGAEGLEGVSDEVLKSHRRVHGRLMEKLAQAAPRAVVWDITFRGRTEHDDDFVRGVKALAAAGIDVVIGRKSWLPAKPGTPEATSPVIAPHVKEGFIMANFDGKHSWSVPAAIQRDARRVEPSLSLVAAASHRHPQTDTVFALRKGEVELMRFQADQGLLRRTGWLGFSELLTTTVPVEEIRDGSPLLQGAYAANQGDQRVAFAFPVPDDSELEKATVEYEAVFGATEAENRNRFRGKTVVVGDFRASNRLDFYAHPDGRPRISGCFGQASAIQAMINDLREPRQAYAHVDRMTLAAIATVMGLITGWLMGRHTGLRLLAHLGWVLALFAISYWLALEHQMIWNPLVCCLALLIAAELAGVVRRAYTSSNHAVLERT